MIQEYSAGVVVYKRVDGELHYLLLHYPSGHWDFAKGHVEQGESNEQAALRELTEETGLTTELVPDFHHQFEYVFRKCDGQLIRKTVTFFVGPARGTVTLSHEHQDMIWLPFDQAFKKLTYTNAQQLLEEVAAYIRGQ